MTTYRFERKFHLDGVHPSFVVADVKAHPAFFSEIYAPRHVNSLYFETPRLDHYFESIDGSHVRTKLRLRWYGDLFGEVARPVLEFKHKRGLVGWKDLFELPPLRMDAELPLTEIRALADVLPPAVAAQFRMVAPLVLVRYRRAYFLSADHAFRLTVDSELEYREVRGSGGPVRHLSRDADVVIVEVKYDREDDEARLGWFMPYRQTKNSKYQNAVTRLLAW